MTSTIAYERRLAIRDDLLDQLLDAATKEERARRLEFVDVGYGDELAWMAHERFVMLAAVNRYLVGAGMPAATPAAITLVESSANGHSDYAEKFAWGCTEIVVGLRDCGTGRITTAPPRQVARAVGL